MRSPFQQPYLAGLYAQYLRGQEASVFVRKASTYYLPGTLERLSQHSAKEVRRAAVLALGFVGDYSSNPIMGRALVDEDRAVRMLADTGIRSIWVRAGSEAERQSLSLIMRLNTAQHYEEAVQQASGLVEKAAWYAEAWNQRAIAYYGLGHYAEVICDCQQVLEINPYHFGAASGMGQAYLHLGNHVSALECFRHALRLNPDLDAVRAQVARLARLVGEK